MKTNRRVLFPCLASWLVALVVTQAGHAADKVKDEQDIKALAVAFENAMNANDAVALSEVFYYDTALTSDPITMTALKTLVGPTQIVFGTDFPFVPTQVTVDGLSKSGFTAEELRGVERENALRFLPKWK